MRKILNITGQKKKTSEFFLQNPKVSHKLQIKHNIYNGRNIYMAESF